MTGPGRNGAPTKAFPSRPARTEANEPPSPGRGQMSKRTRKQKDLTRLAHAGREPARQHGFVNTPIYRGSTVIFPTVAALEANDQDFTYGRLGTPTVRALEEAIAELEGGHRTLLTPSGLSAIATSLLAFVAAGDEMLVVDSVYRPTRRFCDNVLKRLGVNDHLLRPADRRRHREAHHQEDEGRVHRVAGLADFRGAGHSGHRRGCACSRRRGHSRQHLGDAALLQAVRPWRRCVDPGRDEIYRRPCRRHARRHHHERKTVSGDRQDA